MSVEHEVWSVPPGKSRPVLFSVYELGRWQWAQKTLAFLKENGHMKVEVRLELGDFVDGPKEDDL